MGKCKIAGYNKYSKSCSLRKDNPEDALDVADEMAGVMEQAHVEGDSFWVFYNRKCVQSSKMSAVSTLLVSREFKHCTNN